MSYIKLFQQGDDRADDAERLDDDGPWHSFVYDLYILT